MQGPLKGTPDEDLCVFTNIDGYTDPGYLTCLVREPDKLRWPIARLVGKVSASFGKIVCSGSSCCSIDAACTVLWGVSGYS